MKKHMIMFLCALFFTLTACGQNQGIHTPETEPEHHPSAGAASTANTEKHHSDNEEPTHHPSPAEPILPDPSAAQSIREQLRQGISAKEWLPLLAETSWGDLYVPGDETDWTMAALEAIHSYAAETDSPLPEEEYRLLLSCTGGLDGAYSEFYAGELYSLYVRNPTCFARIALDELSPEQREQTIGLLLYDWGYYHSLDDSLPYEERMAALTSRLEEDKQGALNASPDVMLFWYEGQSAAFLPVNSTGIYAASYSSDHPEVAVVDMSGTVTAVGPGSAVITLHFEGDGLTRDFTCAVRCAW